MCIPNSAFKTEMNPIIIHQKSELICKRQVVIMIQYTL